MHFVEFEPNISKWIRILSLRLDVKVLSILLILFRKDCHVFPHPEKAESILMGLW